MKRSIKGFIAGVILTCIALTCFPAFAAGVAKKIDVLLNSVTVKINNKTLSGDNIIYKDNVYIQAKNASDALGKNFAWDKKKNLITIVDKPAPALPSNQYSYANPAPLNTKQTIQVKELLQTYKVEMVINEIIRGDDAWKKIQEANKFNSAAPEGYEYILAKIGVTLLDINDGEQFDLSGAAHMKLIASTGKEYDMQSIVCPEPQLDAKLYKGASSEGWTAFIVKKDDLQPKIAFGRDYNGKGGIWFKAYN